MRVLNPDEVVKQTGLSRCTIWRLEKNGDFPKRLNLSANRVGWEETEICEWIASRPRGICSREFGAAV